jgi:CRP-like cAMP-binding protein/1-acyl-sn-glycerol-3-phosphate acyltransferase
MRDVAAVRRWFTGLALLEQLQGVDRDLFAEHATWVTLQAGARLYGEGQPGAALWFLVEGEIVLGGKPGDAVDGVVRLAITTPGYPVGWDGMVWPGRHRWDAVAASRTLLLRVAREVIDERCRADEGFAARLHQLLLWLAATQLRRQHTRLITSRYDDETDAVAALVASRAEELRVTSALHRIPGYLRSRPTVADAFRALEGIRDGEDAVEAEIAREALDMLAGVRRELRVYLGLQRVYEAVASAPRDVGPAEIRARACRALVDLFTQTEYRIAGLDRLPPTSGNVVLCNHLHSHPTNRLPNGFSLILDTHFVSSMILYRTYGRPPVRVVRDSHWNEAGHARYYARLGYVMVPSSEGPTIAAQRAERYERYVAEASAALRTGHDLVICPEGCPGPTASSPARLRLGAFQLAARLDPEPMIVPVALANFDQRLSRAVFGAVVAEPFRMSDVVADPADRDQVARFVNDDLAPRYRAWVRDAAALR